MCIRDRSDAVLVSTYHKSKGREFDNVFVTITRQPVKDEEKRALYVACLLYTSDAADERSSVDLGGRRIIKKKKDENHEVRVYNIKQIIRRKLDE